MGTPFTRATTPLARAPVVCGACTRPIAAAAMPAAAPARSNQSARFEVVRLMQIRGSRASFAGASLLGDEDRTRPGALLVWAQAIVLERRAIVAVAGLDLGAVALCIELATQTGRIDGECWFL